MTNENKIASCISIYVNVKTGELRCLFLGDGKLPREDEWVETHMIHPPSWIEGIVAGDEEAIEALNYILQFSKYPKPKPKSK